MVAASVHFGLAGGPKVKKFYDGLELLHSCESCAHLANAIHLEGWHEICVRFWAHGSRDSIGQPNWPLLVTVYSQQAFISQKVFGKHECLDLPFIFQKFYDEPECNDGSCKKLFEDGEEGDYDLQMMESKFFHHVRIYVRMCGHLAHIMRSRDGDVDFGNFLHLHTMRA